MTEINYELIAKVTQRSTLTVNYKDVAEVVREFCDSLEKEDPQFDRKKFSEACKPAWMPGTSHDPVWDRIVG